MDIYSRVKTAISASRLEVYRLVGDGDLEVLAKYLWNVALCESFYPTLQTLEVGLRNRLHGVLTIHYRTEYWFDQYPTFLDSRELAIVKQAKEILRYRGKAPDPNRIVAELNFGFWTSLLDSRYEQKLWPKLLKTAFPDMPRSMRTRRNLSSRFNKIRKLRNRVFHHERIVQRNDLIVEHAELLDTIAWIDPEIRMMADINDRFPEVHQKGLLLLLESLKPYFPPIVS
jgi:hypothetical protein